MSLNKADSKSGVAGMSGAVLERSDPNPGHRAIPSAAPAHLMCRGMVPGAWVCTFMGSKARAGAWSVSSGAMGSSDIYGWIAVSLSDIYGWIAVSLCTGGNDD